MIVEDYPRGEYLVGVYTVRESSLEGLEGVEFHVPMVLADSETKCLEIGSVQLDRDDVAELILRLHQWIETGSLRLKGEVRE